MKNWKTWISCGAIGIMSGAQAQHCQLSIFDRSGCGTDGLGFAQVDSVSGAAAPLSYVWSNGDTTAAAQALANGTYTITVTDDNGCVVTDSVVIACTPIIDCRFVTYTQDTWGATGCEGRSAYLNAHFATCFPTGLTLGSTRRLVLTSPQAIITFLPSSGNARPLDPGVRTDPGQNYRNALAGNLAAAILNVTFDACDPGFALSNGALGTLTVREDDFAGRTVNEVIALAQAYINGDASVYSASQFNGALKEINENFHEGDVDDYLICGSGCHAPIMRTTERAHITVYPVPATTALTVELPEHQGSASLMLMDLSGRVVLNAPNVSGTRATLNVEGLPQGAYVLSTAVNGSVLTQCVSITK